MKVMTNRTPVRVDQRSVGEKIRLRSIRFAYLQGSPDHLRMPIKEHVIVDTKLMPSIPLLHSWLPIEVTHIETPTRFYIRYIYGPSWNLGNEPTRSWSLSGGYGHREKLPLFSWSYRCERFTREERCLARANRRHDVCTTLGVHRRK